MMSLSIGSLWWKETETKKYLSGYIQIDGKKIPIVIFKNEYHEGRKPAYNIFRVKEGQHDN